MAFAAVSKKTVTIGKTGDVADGAMKAVMIEGKEILLARAKDKYYAADGICPHMGGHLAQGILSGTIVTCPRHHSRFDLVDGHVVRWTDWTGLQAFGSKLIRPPRPIVLFPVKMDGDNIQIEL